MANKCEYCEMDINPKFPDRKIHKLCEKLKEFSDGRNLTYANEDSYPMSWVPPEKKDIFPNLKPNSRSYCYTHKLIACLILGRDLVSQGEEDSEIVDHIHGSTSKKNFAPHNLRVMNLKDHVHSHKFEGGSEREYDDKKVKKKYQ